MSEVPRSNRPHVVIIGQMGVGKSTLGIALAEAMGMAYVDSDRDVETLFGSTSGVVAAEFGVHALHDIESVVLLGALAREQPSVITAAGSVVDDPLVHVVTERRAQVVWIKADVDEILRRQKDGGHRRAMDRAELLALEDRRSELFASMADLELSADQPPAVLVETVKAALFDRSTTQEV